MNYGLGEDRPSPLLNVSHGTVETLRLRFLRWHKAPFLPSDPGGPESQRGGSAYVFSKYACDAPAPLCTGRPRKPAE